MWSISICHDSDEFVDVSGEVIWEWGRRKGSLLDAARDEEGRIGWERDGRRSKGALGGSSEGVDAGSVARLCPEERTARCGCCRSDSEDSAAWDACSAHGAPTTSHSERVVNLAGHARTPEELERVCACVHKQQCPACREWCCVPSQCHVHFPCRHCP